MKSNPIRCNNPGNIRPATEKWQGEITRFGQPFCEFSTIEYGCRVMLKLLKNYMVRKQLLTVSAIIARWAPVTDNNDPHAYTRAVCQMTGFSPIDEYDASKDFLIPLAKAMTKVEHARKCPEDDVWERAWMLL